MSSASATSRPSRSTTARSTRASSRRSARSSRSPASRAGPLLRLRRFVTAPRILVAACALLLAAAPPALGASALDRKVDGMVAGSQFAGSHTGVAIFDRGAGRLLAVYHGRVELRPASNMKLMTSAAALGRLGFASRLSTRAMATGSLTAGTLHGNL